MAARLTDQQKKRIIADYVELGSYNAVSKVHGVSLNTVKKIVLENEDVAEMCNRKKEQNAADMLAFMESRKHKVQDIIDQLLEAMPEKIKKASLVQLATTYGVLIDKSAMLEGDNKQEESLKVIIDVGNKTE